MHDETKHIWGRGDMRTGFGGKNFFGIDERIILKWTFKKEGGGHGLV